jgi:hypothetical protein
MRHNSCGETKRNLFPVLLLLSLLTLSICVLDSGGKSVSGSVNTPHEGIAPKIDLAPSSAARFFGCGETPINGTSFLPGLSAAESAQSTLTDRDLDTNIMGAAVFDVSSPTDSPILNIPGPDLMVVEMHNPDLINVSISEPETGNTKSLLLRPTPSSNATMNNCQYPMNQVFVELDSLGVPLGSAVPSIRFDNQGIPATGLSGSLVGSDIAEIYILEPPTNNDSLSPFPFLRQN